MKNKELGRRGTPPLEVLQTMKESSPGEGGAETIF
jgi:hypothetical protein